MCISQAVGPSAANGRADVKVVQVLLNANATAFGLAEPLAEDGDFGSKTGSAILAFQESQGLQEHGAIRPDSPTLTRLADGLPKKLGVSAIQGIMARSTEEVVSRYAPALLDRMPANGIDTRLRCMHFLAQIGHESAGFRYTEEIASGRDYEGRADLGNTEPGDGVRFKGRGLIQLTGRANYAAYGKAIGVDLTGTDAYETLATDPVRAVDVACWFWSTKKLNHWADTDDVEKVTYHINGGFNGLEDRKAYLQRARFFVRGPPE